MSLLLARKIKIQPTATIIFKGWLTTCSHCGHAARPEERFHERNRAGEKKGCGARFVAFTFENPASPAEIEMTKKAHQWLSYVPYQDFTQPISTSGADLAHA